MKILLVGGGSGGSVSPLLAVAQEVTKTEKATFLFIGTKYGPEKEMCKQHGIVFESIVAGKWRRYFSLKNIFSPFFILIGLIQSLIKIKKFKPDVVFGCGSFVQVPVVFAAWCFGVPVLIHQQDFYPGLANKISQIFAKKITVTFKDSIQDFSSGSGLFGSKIPEKVIWTGNPWRADLADSEISEARKLFGLTKDLPVLLVLGGGTGAEFINNLVMNSLPNLTKTMQVLHSTGKGKKTDINMENYKPFEFISNMAAAYSVADIVISRAGLSSITELCNLGKVSIIIPMPNSHQVVNAALLDKYKAALVVFQNEINSENLTNFLRKLMFSKELLDSLKKNSQLLMKKDSTKRVADILMRLIK